MKRKLLIAITTVFVILILLILNTKPTLAIRTHLFLSGYIYESIATEIKDDEFHNRVDKDTLESQNAKCYTLTIPPIEKATQGELRTFKVTKKGYFYSVEYYGEG